VYDTRALLDRLEAAGCRPRRSGRGWRALCPLHDDTDPSLMVHDATGRPLVFCHGGCGRRPGFFGELLATLSTVDVTRVSSARRRRARRDRHGVRDSYEPISGAWVYTDDAGRPLARKVRQVRVDAFTRQRRREFRWQRPVTRPGGGGRVTWMASHGEVEPAALPLYDLPWLRAARARGARLVAVTEGESDCATLRAQGLAATCAPNGSGAWQPQWTEELRPWPEVVVVVDNDPAGRARGEQVGAALRAAGCAVRVLAPPAPFNDVTDLLRAGRPVSALVEFSP